MRLTFIAIALLAMIAGCGKGPTTKATNAARIADDPWQKALAALRRETDVEPCRRALLELNTDLSKVPTAEQPAEMPPADLAALTADLGLNDAEAKELKSSAYTALDGAYLAEVIYLCDVALGLDVSTLPPAKRATIAFEWVTRQVVLNPWMSQGKNMQPLTPSFVLRRGSGSGLERAYVFIELCRQLNLNAYLIGPPEAKNRTWDYRSTADAKTPPRGPFWVVGVRIEKQIALFDPWSGEALPFNLEQLRAQPAEFAPQFAALAKSNGIEAGEFRKAEPFLAVPLSGFAPRWKILEEKLAADRGVALAADAAFLKKHAGGGFWNPKNNFTLTRTLAYLLSASEGGFAPNGQEGRSPLAWQYTGSLVPGQRLIAVPNELDFKEPRERIVSESVGRYLKSFLVPPTPRARFQRGRYAEATKMLVKEWDAYNKMTERVRNEPERTKTIAEWIKRANDLYGELNGAANPAVQDQAQQEVNRFWKADVRGLELLVEQSVGTPGTGEATYLLALCKNEQAERLVGRGTNDPNAIVEAWREASDWWQRYRPFADAQEASYPGRKAHAEKLAVRAQHMAGTAR